MKKCRNCGGSKYSFPYKKQEGYFSGLTMIACLQCGKEISTSTPAKNNVRNPLGKPRHVSGN